MKNVQKQTPSLLLIITLVGFPQISESIITPILPALSHLLRVSASQIQLTMSTYFVAFAIGVLIFGQLADRFGRRPAMLGGILVYFIGNIGLWASPSFGWLLVFRLVQAFGASAGSVVTQTIMRECFHGVHGAKVFAQTSAALALAPALGPLIGGYVQLWFGPRPVFEVLIAMAVMIGLYAGWRLPETRQLTTVTTVKQWPIIRQLLTDRVVWSYGILIGGINGCLFSYYAEAPFIFETHFGYTASQYGWLGLVMAAASLLGAVTVNALLAHSTPRQLILGGLILSLVAAGGMAVAANCNTAIGMLGGIFVFFYGLNIVLPNALNRALNGYEVVMGSASGWFSLGYYLLVSALTYLMSWWHNGQLDCLPQYMAVVTIAMLLSYWWGLRRERG
ncbi:multidrug effflux MFS transporter [Lactiplantibacillus fabifermentans]|uniref:Bcr/CflA family efflux transporter n=2 Tax=Lactiplantibacillus fabifermentans TaxID=483011 RepID=A0A0R2NRH3_9LACO|nr:multidrug effflux MFS transporter [Lactiplantibacillus fabifermentans]ETY74321.1 bicyclomycin resistance protein [Lactiplantibacillus fabifermentans T30PCM01]KRO27024.1 major facilitator superfamily permease [Lactiplantibacillus fabifermentans DSM 21115]